MSAAIETDIIIIGAGPVGLFTVFEAGLLKLHCHLIDALPKPGGQLTEIYPKKPIYDIPGFPSVLAGDLIENLMEQIAPFKPGFTLGERAEKIHQLENGHFEVITHKGTVHRAPNIAIAGGLGCFEPRKPPIPNLEQYEDNGVDYIVKDPEKYRGKKLMIAGGGDSALDWSIFLADVASNVTLVHHRTEFRGHPDNVQKVLDLAGGGKINLITNCTVTELRGTPALKSVVVMREGQEDAVIAADYYLPLFGLSPKLGPIADWGLQVSKNAVEVNTEDYSTQVPGIYAVGDINTYPGKLKLILCGFHEATLMVQSAFKRIYPNKNVVLKYTTVSGVQGFS
ncbi:MAG: NAD(P)/FAD-dependent oxidoreductase [Bacteroidetes bacterium]|nr:NAD(P)/FAD-dependent oxidoreductase [Bacteroidota bacterium]